MNADEFNQLIGNITYDKCAAETLYKYYYDRALNYLSVKYDFKLSEDSVQDFFLMILIKADELNPVVHPTSWVYRCCENIAKNYVRKEKWLTVFNENLSTAKFHQNEDTTEILNGINSLDNCTRRLFLMHYFEGYSLMEIADLLNINYNTVKQLHRRGKIKLEKFFNENISL